MHSTDTRKQFLALARRRARPGSGSHQLLLQARTAVYPVVDLRSIIKHTPFVVVGGVATRLYMPERMTLDLDILVLSEDAPALYRELEQAACHLVGTLTIGGTTWELPGGTLLDVIASAEQWARDAVHNPRVDATGLPVIALPYLVVMKLRASRVQDLADITRMLGTADETALEEVRRVIQLYAPDALEDIESMIALGRLELS
jgi:hypothetical protein